MPAERPGGNRKALALLALSATVLCLTSCAQTGGVDGDSGPPGEPSRPLPWEWWRDLGLIASVPAGDRVVMRSSHCPTGCEHDRHSEGDSRFLRINDRGEGVIFETEGAGAVTRIWMVMGDGVSRPLDRGIRLKIRIDGRRRPVVDLPLPDLFSGRTPPFVAPLVADADASGGGNVSYLPIPFSSGCEISLSNAHRAKIWFQVTARLVADGHSIRPFTGAEPTGGLRSLLQRAGADPWPGPPSPPRSGSVVLAPGGGELVATLEGPDMINGLLIRTPKNHWHRLGVRLGFDGREPQLIPLRDLFGVLDTEGGPTRSLLIGADGDRDLYCYFPMPFFERATVEIMRRPVEGPARVRVEYAIRTAGRQPPGDAGYFGVQVRRHRPSEIGRDLALLELDGAGAWVGLVTEMAPADTREWTFLEGDERVFIDGETEPSWHGTGIEDLFNGGFYFNSDDGVPRPFATALAGAPVLRRSPPRAVMYRLLLADAVVFRNGIRAGLEIGPQNDLSVNGRTVAYFYQAPDDGRAVRSAAQDEVGAPGETDR